MKKTNRQSTLTFQFFILVLILLVSCKDDDDNVSPEVITIDIKDLYVGSETNGFGVFLDLEAGTVLLNKADSNSNKWDLAFYGPWIRTNGGSSGPGQGAALVLEEDFATVSMAPSDGYKIDEENNFAIPIPAQGGSGWFIFTGFTQNPNNAILSVANRTIVIKTGSGNFAKIEILSFYEGSPNAFTSEFEDLAHVQNQGLSLLGTVFS